MTKSNEEVLDKKTVEKIRKDTIDEFNKEYKEELVKELSEKVSNEVTAKFDRESRVKIIDDITTDVKDEIKNQIYKEERKLGAHKSFKIFRLYIYILVLIAAIGYVGYRLYKTDSIDLLKYNYEPEKKLETPAIGEDVKTTPTEKKEEVIDYKALYGNLINEFKIYDYSLYKKNVKVSDLTNVQKLQMAYSTLLESDKEVDGTIINIKSSVLKKAYIKLFGTDDYEPVSFNVYNLNFAYSLAKSEYIGIIYVNNTEDVSYELIDAGVSDDGIYVKAYVAKVSNGKIYNVKTNKEVGNANSKLSDYGNRLNIATFKFTKDKNFVGISCE